MAKSNEKFRNYWIAKSVIKIPIQVNGKTRGFVEVAAEADEKTVLSLAKEEIKNKLTGDIIKEIYVKGRIINFVVKGN